VDVVCDMLADTGMGFTKEEANHNLDNNQRADVMAANIVDAKSNRSQMAIDVSVANILCLHTAKIPRRRRSKSGNSPSISSTTTLDEQRTQSSYQRW
jgi:hypothetical protein